MLPHNSYVKKQRGSTSQSKRSNLLKTLNPKNQDNLSQGKDQLPKIDRFNETLDTKSLINKY